jgi:hypothetical protein
MPRVLLLTERHHYHSKGFASHLGGCTEIYPGLVSEDYMRSELGDDMVERMLALKVLLPVEPAWGEEIGPQGGKA